MKGNYDVTKMNTKVLLPNGDWASTTCISYNKLLTSLNFNRDVSIVEIVPREVVDTMKDAWRNTYKNIDTLLELTKDWDTEITKILLIADAEGCGVALWAIESDYDAYMHLIQDEIYAELGGRVNRAVSQKYKMVHKSGAGVRYNRYKAGGCLEIIGGNNVIADEVEVSICFYDEDFCRQYDLVPKQYYAYTDVTGVVLYTSQEHSRNLPIRNNIPVKQSPEQDKNEYLKYPVVCEENIAHVNWAEGQVPSDEDRFFGIIYEALRFKDSNNLPHPFELKEAGLI